MSLTSRRGADNAILPGWQTWEKEVVSEGQSWVQPSPLPVSGSSASLSELYILQDGSGNTGGSENWR
jgi:hypothetical protein